MYTLFTCLSFFPSVTGGTGVAEEQGVGEGPGCVRTAGGGDSDKALRGGSCSLPAERQRNWLVPGGGSPCSKTPGVRTGTAGLRKDLTNSLTLSPGFHFTPLAVRGV